MKTVALDDERLYRAVEAAKSGRSVEDVGGEALEQWLANIEMDELEQTEIESAQVEWQRKGGVEAHEFFRTLREEERTEQATEMPHRVERPPAAQRQVRRIGPQIRQRMEDATYDFEQNPSREGDTQMISPHLLETNFRWGDRTKLTHAVRSYLSKFKKVGSVEHVAIGVYRITEAGKERLRWYREEFCDPLPMRPNLDASFETATFAIISVSASSSVTK